MSGGVDRTRSGAGPLVVLGLLVVLFTSACGSAADGPAEPPGRPSLDLFAQEMQLAQYDYDPAADPGALAERSDVVVRGMIVSVTRGRSSAPAPDLPVDTVTSVLEVQVDEILAGDPSLIHEGSVYVEVDHPALVGTGKADSEEGGGEWVPFDLEGFAETVPMGVPGVFFLIDVTDRTLSGSLVDPEAGRPPGARMLATHVQGFLLQAGGEELISVNEPLSLMPQGWRNLDDLREVSALVGLAE